MTFLIGCFTIPSTYTKLSNGKPRPESLIGDGRGDKIILGQTRIEDALIAIHDATNGETPPAPALFSFVPGSREPADWTTWSFDADARDVGVQYRLRTGTTVFPLCFAATPKDDYRVLRLRTSENGIVIATDTFEVDDPKIAGRKSGRAEPERLFAVLPPAARAELVSAGVLPDDASIRAIASIFGGRRRLFSTTTTAPVTRQAN